MLNDDGQFPTSSASGPTRRPAVKSSSLTCWVQQVIGRRDLRVKMRLRGNNLHILCEGPQCPDAEAIVPQLRAALATTSLEPWLVADDSAQVHRMLVHGRQVGQKEAAWSQRIDLSGQTPFSQAQQPQNAISVNGDAVSQAPVATAIAQPPGPQPPTVLDSILKLAQQGQPDAIARYLSNALSTFNIAIRARIKPPPPAVITPAADAASQITQPTSAKRLLVICESTYSPDAALLAAPIAQKLRELELQGFRDALVFGQVRGEAQPEWITRVDLTPPDEILQEWSRWGDVQAITRLLNRSLASQRLKFSALLKESTLHLTCAGDAGAPPDQAMAIAAIRSLLQPLAPQGIHAVTIYGVAHLPDESSDVLPAWVHWLHLPAAQQSALAVPTLELAKQGNLEAITFLLTRLLNPNLEDKLALGGIRVQIRQKGDLLHIMADALVCPRQDAIVPTIVRCLKPLQVASVAGVRIYGRRAGQQQPLWNYGVDFISRSRLVPEATPEFAASDVHVDDLLAPPGAIVLWSELPPDDWRAKLYGWFEETLKQVQRSLIGTQLFIPSETAQLSPTLAPNTPSLTPSSRQRLGIAVLWGTVGLLLVVQTDWLLGRWIQPLVAQDSAPTKPVSVPSPSPLVVSPPPSQPPAVPLNKPKAQNWDSFNASGFTQPGSTVVSPPAKEKPTNSPTPLPASPLQAKADQLPDFKVDYPTFNSRQLDRQLVVYQRYLEVNGPPDVLIVGSSRALRGIDPAQLKAALVEQGYAGVKIFNFGINGATVQVVDWLIRQVLPQEKLPKLILFADGARAFNSGRPDLTYNGILASQGYRMLAAGTPPIAGTITAKAAPAQSHPSGGNATHSVTENSPTPPSNPYQALNDSFNKALGGFSVAYSQRDRLKTRLREQFMAWLPQQDLSSKSLIASSDSLINSSSPPAAATSAPSLASDGEGMIDIEGFLPLSVQFNPVTYYQKYARVPGDYDTDYEAFSLQGSQTEALMNLAQFAKTRQIPLVFVNLPLTQEYLDPIRRQHEQAFQAHLLSLAPQLGIAFRDLSEALITQSNYFSDPSHLNRYGAYEVSRRLAQDVMIPWQVTR